MKSELSRRDPVEVLGEEFLAQWRRDENPTIQQYVASHPEYAEQIRALFPMMLAMEKLKANKEASTPRPIRLHVDRLERLGDYRIIREIGHGGMGIVYEAEQESLRRHVAVKVFPKQALGDSQQLKRFQREAETAGGLHHTNIVPVFGVGEQDGLHYFVMQLLDGAPLDQVIRGLAARSSARVRDPIERVVQGVCHSAVVHELSTADVIATDQPPVVSSAREVLADFGPGHWRRIAEIGSQVADALHYAHSKGILHRDIKPSNLILGKDAQVWVTDFGLAIAADQDRLSRSGDVVGTLRYMSPEQLAGQSDVRSDVYGLGLTLYELMTLKPAFEGENRGSLVRKVSKSTPPAPRSICRQIPRDLETIILKAIARSPESRYRTAADFADDLRRFCQDQPIQARRIGPIERVSRWSRRNPALAGMGAALAVGTVISLAAVSWNWRRAVAEKHNAVVEASRAETNLTLALGSMDRLLERFESDWMSHPLPPDSASPDANRARFVVSDQSAVILKEALVFYEQFAQQNVNSPKLQRDTAKAYRRVGDILNRLGRYGDALPAYRQSAATLIQEMQHADTPEPELIAETAAVLNRLAMTLHGRNLSGEARQQLEYAQQILADEVARREDSLDCLYELAMTQSNLGLVLWRLHEGQESVQRHRRAIFLLEGLAEQEPQDAQYRLGLAHAYRNYFPIAAACKERLYANQIRESAKQILEDLVRDYPMVPDYRCELSEMLVFTLDRTEDADKGRIQDAERAVELARKLSQEFRAIPRYETALAKGLSIHATLYRETDLTTALKEHQQAGDIMRGLCTRFPDVEAYHMILADALHEEASTLGDLDRGEEAICVLEEAISHQSAFLSSQPNSSVGRKAMAEHLNAMADLMSSLDEDRAHEFRSVAQQFWRRRPTAE
jgi:eukaryotic-like serine/threonine-protein kinase